jgi:hypothetical protein
LTARSARHGRWHDGCKEGDETDERGPRVRVGAHERASEPALMRGPPTEQRGKERERVHGGGGVRRRYVGHLAESGLSHAG